MIKNVLTDIGGIGIYGVISVVLFFTVFGGSLIWAFLLRKSFLNDMSRLPLEDGVQTNQQKGISHDE